MKSSPPIERLVAALKRLPGIGSFEEWSDLVRSAVVYHGLPDPGLARVTRSALGGYSALPVSTSDR